MASIVVYLRSRPRLLLRAAAPACSSSSRSHLFSSSSSPPDFSDGNPQTSGNNQSNSRSSFSDLKSHLRGDGEANQQPPRKPFSFSQGGRYEPNPPSSIFIQEIRDNLKGFRSSEQAPQPAPQISFQNLYRKSRAEPLPTDKSSSTLSSFDAIKDSLSQMTVSETRKTPNVNLSKFRDRLNLRQNVESAHSSRVIGGTTEGLPLSVFGKELFEKSNKGGIIEDVNNNSLMKDYSCPELGEQLRKLRPEGVEKGENWFSISELNQRLIKLKEIEKQEKQQSSAGPFAGLKETLTTVQQITYDQERMNSAHRADIIGHLSRGTPNYMFSTPKEHLVEKYFHPDNMSAAEKLKTELRHARDEFKMSDTDCGSARVQIAQLTTEIHYLSKCLHKKDKHSRKGLIAKVQMRKKLLKYLRRTDWDSYCFILSSLGLRDNPGYKQVKQ